MSRNLRYIIVAPCVHIKHVTKPGLYKGDDISSILKERGLCDFWKKTARLLDTLNQLSGGESQLTSTDDILKCIGSVDYYFLSESETTQDWDEESKMFLDKLSELKKSGLVFDQIISYNVLYEKKDKGLDLGLIRQPAKSERKWEWGCESEKDENEFKRRLHCWILDDVEDGSSVLVIDCYNPRGSEFCLQDFKDAFKDRMAFLLKAENVQVFRDAYKDAIDEVL